jgi:hypothetical protein
MSTEESLEKYQKMMSLREQLKNCKDDNKSLEIQAKLLELIVDSVKDDEFKKFLATQSLLKKDLKV